MLALLLALTKATARDPTAGNRRGLEAGPSLLEPPGEAPPRPMPWLRPETLRGGSR